jgi:hypothetical protein
VTPAAAKVGAPSRVDHRTMPAPRAALALALAALLAAASSCAAPLQNGGVEVRPGAEERLDTLCRYRTSGGSQQLCAAPVEGEE